MSDEDALLAAIAAHPDEDTPRLVYADWLDEHATTDARRARAEFVRVQIASHNLPEGQRDDRLDARAEELLRAFGAEWVAAFPVPEVELLDFHRGFLWRLELDAARCAQAPPPPWSREPVANVYLTGGAEQSERLLGAGWFDGAAVLNLHLKPAGGGDAVAKAVARSRCPDSLRALGLWDDGFTDGGLRALAGAAFRQLRELSCMGVFTAAGWCDVLAAPAAEKLVDLTVGHRGPSESPWTAPGPGLVTALTAAPHIAGLRQLWLDRCGIGSDGVAALVTCGRLPVLERLHLADEEFDGVTGRALADADFPALKALLISASGFNDGATEALAAGPLLGRLEQLDLSSNRLTAAGAAALARSGRTGRLKELDLSFNPVGDDGVLALMTGDAFPALTWLNLASVGMTDRGADAILRAGWLDRLTYLFLSYNPVSAAMRDALLARFGSRVSIARRDPD